MQNNIKQSKICIIQVSEGEERDKMWPKKYLKN